MTFEVFTIICFIATVAIVPIYMWLLYNIKNSYEKIGLKVEINNPYAGGYITRHYGNPLIGIETIQIEINRSLYMDETNLKIHKIDNLQKIFSEIFNNFEYSQREAAE